MAVPSVGRIVHYVSYGTPGGEYKSECRAAVIAEVLPEHKDDAYNVNLVVLNPGGVFFHHSTHDENKSGGSWHWPEMV